ncbi:hypothetical protein M5D96_005942 [Drosophila gunungcola]|uniref:Uncharacterized protein n=1 Tax=Drosophila gunungcola TaxID=103775 RepID=A0A9Q0BR92_9MUSC|nr:hypothetical protein M5D96_005942 [Drosophila gunungcola]
MQHQSSPRHALSDVLSASHMVTTSQPMMGMGGGGSGIGGAGGGISIGGAELKPRFYDEVRGPSPLATLSHTQAHPFTTKISKNI